MPHAIDEYLDILDALQRLDERFVNAADYLLEISKLMRSDPDRALAAISSDWPTAEQLCALINEITNAEKLLKQHWDKLPERYKNAIESSHPDNAGVDLGERTFEEVRIAFRAVWHRGSSEPLSAAAAEHDDREEEPIDEPVEEPVDEPVDKPMSQWTRLWMPIDKWKFP
jgi:hypothetical protein